MNIKKFVSRHPETFSAVQYTGTNMQEILDWCKTFERSLTMLEVWLPQIKVGAWVLRTESDVPNWPDKANILSNSEFTAAYRPAETSELVDDDANDQELG